MLKIHGDVTSMKTCPMSPMEKIPLSDACKERELQQLIFNNWDAFKTEIGEKDLFLVGQEVKPSSNVEDRIDLLAFAQDGTAVIIELKRHNNKWQLSQALCYAAMVSEWTKEERDKKLAEHGRSVQALEDHVGENQINGSQRIILIAESYDYEVLITAKWLIGSAIRVSCWQVALARDPDGPREYLHFVQVFPPKEVEEIAIQRGRERVAAAGRAKKTIEELLENCTNADAKAFFEKRLDLPRSSNRDALTYTVAGTIRWYVSPRSDRAWVNQIGRFSGDQATWSEKVSQPAFSAQKRGNFIFYLTKASDFESFEQFVKQHGDTLTWSKNVEGGEAETVVDAQEATA
jgi:hypothetical protein